MHSPIKKISKKIANMYTKIFSKPIREKGIYMQFLMRLDHFLGERLEKRRFQLSTQNVWDS